MPRCRALATITVLLAVVVNLQALSHPVRARDGMIATQSDPATRVGAEILRQGGNAVDATVASSFALAVTFPFAGNIGGGGFLVLRTAAGDAVAYDFREMAPAKSSPTMFLKDGKYDSAVHHNSHIAVGVPGTVAGLHLAWTEHGSMPWEKLIEPAITLARDGFVVSDQLSRSLKGVLPNMKPYPASIAQFSKNGVPYEAGETLKQPVLAQTLERIATQGPAGFYAGPVAKAIADDMAANGGLITEADLKAYKAIRRTPIRAAYRGHEIISMPPPSSGGIAVAQILGMLEGYDLKALGGGSADYVHLAGEAMRRAFADRARYIGDPDFNTNMPIPRLLSPEYLTTQRKTISMTKAAVSSPTSFEWKAEGTETTQVSVVDKQMNAVSMTYTLESGYGMKATVPGAGFLLNNEMGDFNGAPGLTTAEGLIGTEPNMAAPGKRMLSSMTPTILTKDGQLLMVTGSPGGRTIINTVVETIVNIVDFGMNAQEAVDAPRFHHQWLPDRIQVERNGFSPDTLKELTSRGHAITQAASQGVAQVIVVNSAEKLLEGATDRRVADGAAIGVNGSRLIEH